MLAITKCATDVAPIVRRTAAIALAKAHHITKGESLEASVEWISRLLGDRDREVVGAAAVTFMEVCPTRFDVVHRHFRGLCRHLLEASEWAQAVILRLLLRYSRANFEPAAAQQRRREADRAQEEESEVSDSDSDDDAVTAAAKRARRAKQASKKPDITLTGGLIDLDDDLRLLLQSVRPLLFSTNTAVILGVCSIIYHCGPAAELDACVKPLLRVMNNYAPGPRLSGLVALHSVALVRPNGLRPFFRDFFPYPDDSPAERDIKARVLAKLATVQSLPAIITEMKGNFRCMDSARVVSAVRTLGLVAFTVPGAARDLTRVLTPLLAHNEPTVVSACVVTLRQLVAQGNDVTTTLRTIQHLARGILANKITADDARAAVLGLVGDNMRAHPSIAKLAPDMFRTFLKSFKDESVIVRRQIIALGQRLFLNMEGAAEGEVAQRFMAMYRYALELGRFDVDYDLRDTVAVLRRALDPASATFAALKASYLVERPVPELQDPLGDRAHLELLSLSHLEGHEMPGYTPLPPQPEESTAAALRDPPGATANARAAAAMLGSSTSETSSSASSSSETESSSSSSSDSDSETESSSGSDASSAAPAKKPPVAVPARVAPSAPRMKISIKTVATAPRAAAASKGEQVLDTFFKPKPAAPAPAPAAAAPVAAAAVASASADGSRAPSEEKHVDPTTDVAVEPSAAVESTAVEE
jgi:AP-3 complex subunit beta